MLLIITSIAKMSTIAKISDCAYSSKMTQILQKPPSELIKYAKNSRTHSSRQIERIKASIKEFGFLNPVIITKDDVIIAGHARVQAAIALEIPTIPTVCASHLTQAKISAYVIADNKLAEFSKWDDTILDEELRMLASSDFDLSIIGFDDLEFNDIAPTADMVPMPSEDATPVQLGDIFLLGEHKLICGDCTDKDVIDDLLDGVMIDSVQTDPPYGVNLGDKNRHLERARKGSRITTDIVNDNIDDYQSFFASFLSIIPLSAYNTVYCWMSGLKLQELRSAFDDAGITLGDYLIWVKNNHVLGRKDYNSRHEFCMYGWKGKHRFYGGHPDTILEFNKPLKNDLHPTMKPVEMIAKLIMDGTKKGMNVYDAFTGSGSTLIACEQTDRIFYGVEIDPHYCAVTIKRWEEFTGKTAKKVRDEEVSSGIR